MDQGKPPGAMGQPKTGRGQRASWSAAAGAAEGEVDHGRTQNIAASFTDAAILLIMMIKTLNNRLTASGITFYQIN